jgi:dTMP kinase
VTSTVSDPVTRVPKRESPRLIALEGIDGAGKTTLATALVDRLGLNGRTALSSRLSARSAGIFRALVGDVGQSVRYQDVLPGAFRRTSYIIDAVAQFGYLKETYEKYDYLIFDRWLPTYDVYCPGRSVHDEWYEKMMTTLPQPDLLFHLRVSPEVAAERIAGRGDWSLENWGPAELLADLRRLCAAYDDRMARCRGVVVLDANATADELLAQVLAAIRSRGSDPLTAEGN